MSKFAVDVLNAMIELRATTGTVYVDLALVVAVGNPFDPSKGRGGDLCRQVMLQHGHKVYVIDSAENRSALGLPDQPNATPQPKKKRGRPRKEE